MDLTPIWTLIPTGASIVLGLVLLALGRRQRWSDPVPTEPSPTREAAQSQISGDFKTRVRAFLEAHRRELLLTAVCLGVLTYALLSAPVQINGEIATSPKEPGRPFYFIHWQRNHLFYFYHQTASVSNVATGLLALTLTMIAGFRKSAQMARTGLLWSFISLAGSAQWMVSGSVQLPIGVVLYLLAGAGLLFWSLISQTRIESDLEESHPIAFKWEAVFVILIIALASFGRLFALQNIPYGIEGDEAKWTAEVVSLGLRGDPDSNGLYHRDALPVSFYMQTLFQRMMGPSLFAGRFEVAIFSIIATFVFYLLLRQITNQPLALVAAWLLSSCVFDISASRLANVESHVKIWPILTLALLAWALHKKHWTHHAISGIALTLGLLTYDTVWPLGLVALLITVIEARRNKDTLRNAIQNLAAILTPVLLSMPFIIPYLSSRLSYYEIGSKGWEAGAIVLWKHFLDVVISWYVAVKQDFIYNRTGPILNGFLLPWLTFGLIAAASTLRKRLSFWSVAWALIFILPVPILTHSPLGRVYYPGLPAVYILIAIGLYIFTRESLRALGSALTPLVTAICVTFLVWIPLFNFYIYFNEVDDFEDRQMRREVAEMAKEAASEDNFLALVSVPRANEALNNEFQMIELFMLEKLPIEQIASSYKNVAIEDVLPNLANLSDRPKRSIVFDNKTTIERSKRDTLMNAIKMCYPDAHWETGNFFSRADLTADMLANPNCTSATLTLENESPSLFEWNLSAGSASTLTLTCEQFVSERVWIEAETLNLYPGWQTETAFAQNWGGDGFLMDNFGSLPMLFDIESAEGKPIYLWVRYYKRTVDDYPAQITLNGKTYSFDRTGEENLNQWVWERLGPFETQPGTNTAELNRPYTGNPQEFMAIFIDTFVISSSADFSPTGNNSLRLPVKTFSFPETLSRGNIVFQLEPGSYRCYAEAENEKKPIMDSLGITPVRSNEIELKILP